MTSPTFCSQLITCARQHNFRVFVLRKPVLHILLLGCLAFLLIACGGTNTTPAKKSSPTPTPVPPGQLLFQADWSHGLAGWQASAGWKVVDGNLESDTGNELSLTIPYQPKTSYYAVDFGVQIINVPQQGAYFQLVAQRVPGKNGYQAYVNSIRPSTSKIFSIHPNESVIIEPIDAMDAMQQVKDYEPGFKLHTYRVEVRGASVEFYIDGQRASTATSSQTPMLSTGPLRLQCSGVAIHVSNLRITTT